MVKRTRIVLMAAVALVAFVAVAVLPLTPLGHRLMVKLRGAKSVEDRLAEFGNASRERWRGDFVVAGVGYPPEDVTLYAVKADRQLHVYADGRLVRTIDVLGQSGTLGPKRREGDRQVPEGIYAIESLHPNSRFHVALRVAYPNDLDRQIAERDGRDHSTLGGDIMIHGGNASVGCLALGDPAAEDVFTLAADTGVAKVTVHIVGVDERSPSAAD